MDRSQILSGDLLSQGEHFHNKFHNILHINDAETFILFFLK